MYLGTMRKKLHPLQNVVFGLVLTISACIVAGMFQIFLTKYVMSASEANLSVLHEHLLRLLGVIYNTCYRKMHS